MNIPAMLDQLKREHLIITNLIAEFESLELTRNGRRKLGRPRKSLLPLCKCGRPANHTGPCAARRESAAGGAS